jgi:hypothetical protein
MIYWQYVDLDPVEVDKIKEDYLTHLPNNSHFFQMIDIESKTFMGMELLRPVLIQVEARAKGRIHTDFRPDKNFGDQLAIQIPLINCEHSVTELWSSDYEPPVQYTTNGQPYNYFEKSRCVKVSEFVLTHPVIWRTDVPHSVSNYSDGPRLAISLRFKKDPWNLINGPVHILS